MNLTKILAISGKSGLYRLEVQTRGGFLATSLADDKRITVGIRNNVSLLSEIAIYTIDKEVPLAEIFKSMKTLEQGNEARVSAKADGATLESYFAEVLPTYDRDRVYASDIKKVIQWYNLLLKKGLLEEEEAEIAPDTTSATE
jgi:hypothetical protein